MPVGGPTTGRSTREPAERRRSADELKRAERGSAPCGEERTGSAGRAGQSARISPDADGASGWFGRMSIPAPPNGYRGPGVRGSRGPSGSAHAAHAHGPPGVQTSPVPRFADHRDLGAVTPTAWRRRAGRCPEPAAYAASKWYMTSLKRSRAKVKRNTSGSAPTQYRACSAEGGMKTAVPGPISVRVSSISTTPRPLST